MSESTDAHQKSLPVSAPGEDAPMTSPNQTPQITDDRNIQWLRREVTMFGDSDDARMSAARQYLAAVDAGHTIRHTVVRKLITDLDSTPALTAMPRAFIAAIVTAVALLVGASLTTHWLTQIPLSAAQWAAVGIGLWYGLTLLLTVMWRKRSRSYRDRRTAFAHQHLAAELPNYIPWKKGRRIE